MSGSNCFFRFGVHAEPANGKYGVEITPWNRLESLALLVV